MRAVFLLISVIVLSCPLISFGWGQHGHTLVGEAAASALPDEMPDFFRFAGSQLGYLNGEPDRWRDEAELSLIDHSVFLEVVPEETLQARDRYAFIDTLRSRGITSPAVGPIRSSSIPGLLPFRALELTLQLRSSFRRWRSAADSLQRTWIEARIIDDAGLLGHYVADGANPHHTSVHMFGWFGPNENRFATDEAFHSRFETQYVASHLQLKDFVERVPPVPRVLRDIRGEMLRYLRKSHSLVEQLYRLDRQESFGPSTKGREHREFTVQRLTDGAAMLRDLWWTAWVTSGER